MHSFSHHRLLRFDIRVQFIVKAIHFYLIDNRVPLQKKSIWFHFLAVHYEMNIAQYGQSSGYYVCRLLIYTHIWLRIKTQNSAKHMEYYASVDGAKRSWIKDKHSKIQREWNKKCSYRSSQPSQPINWIDCSWHFRRLVLMTSYQDSWTASYVTNDVAHIVCVFTIRITVNDSVCAPWLYNELNLMIDPMHNIII